MKRKFLSLLLCLAMVTAMLPAAMASAPVSTAKLERCELAQRMADNPTAGLTSDEQTRFIDRISGTLDAVSRSFYSVLEEAADNDGDRDYLIADSAYDLTSFTPFVFLQDAANGSAVHIEAYTFGGKVHFSGLFVGKVPSAQGDTLGENVQRVFYAFCYDHPEVFWLNDVFFVYTLTTDGNDYVYLLLNAPELDADADLRAEPLRSEAAIRTWISTMEQDIQSALAGVPQGASRYQTVAHFNRWLTGRNAYGTDFSGNSWLTSASAGALHGASGVNGPVCEGYAHAMKVLCDRAGIPCVIQDGDCIMEGQAYAHMWNLVRMEDGCWYAVDVTWNDPVDPDNPEAVVSGYECENWLLVGSDTLAEPGLTFAGTHVVKNDPSSSHNIVYGAGPAPAPTAYITLTYSPMAPTKSAGTYVTMTPTLGPVRQDWDAFGPDYTYQITTGTLPAGLTLDPATGVISGTLAQTLSGRITATVTAFEACGTGLRAAACCKVVFSDDAPSGVWNNPFTDLAAGAFYQNAVRWASEHAITTGVTATTFAPGNPCTRAQIVTFLWRAAGSPAPNNLINPFSDVPSNAYYRLAVLWAVERGITTGISASTFGPDRPCTRGQAVTFLHRLAGSPAAQRSTIRPFDDVGTSAYYSQPVLWALEQGITTGTAYACFSPSSTCTRGHIVTFLHRARDLF